MYKTKRELDTYVEDIFSKIKGEREKCTRCFNIAKQYARLNEFITAVRYMERYLTTNPSNAAEAIKLMGDYYQEANDFNKALELYKASYKSRKTREVLKKICDLLEAGHGTSEDQGEGRQKWNAELQRTSATFSSPQPLHFGHGSGTATFTTNNLTSNNSPGIPLYSSLNMSSNILRSSLNTAHHNVNGIDSHEESFSTSPKVHYSPEVQARSIEKRFEDVLSKILNSVQRIEGEVKDLKNKVENISHVQDELVESHSRNQKANMAKSNTADQNENATPTTQPQQLPPLMQPNPPFGYGLPYPHPYMNPFFMADPALSYVTNPMLAAAALYGNPLFGNPLAAAGIPRNEVPQTVTTPNPNESPLLTGLLNKNQFMSQTSSANAPMGDGIYPQSQLQAHIASNASLTDKLWPQPELVPTSVGLGTIFPNSDGAPSSSVKTALNNVARTPENSNKVSNASASSAKTPTNTVFVTTGAAETPKSSSTSMPPAKKDVKGKALFPENVVVSNTEKVPTISSTAFDSNVLSVTIPPEHRNAGIGNNNTNTSTIGALNTSLSENKNVSNTHDFQISAPLFKPQEPKFDGTKSQEETANPFSSISLTAPTFGDLAKSAATTGFMGFQNVNTFSGVGTPVFGNVIASQSAAGDAVVRQDRVDGEEVTDEFVPTAEFQPVIPLPPLVEVKKGNENENTLFEHRAKIYRFVKESKEWKERGVGNIMVLQDKDNPLKIRVVMWRERVYKLACNHWITKDLVIENHQGSPKILKWTVLDFAEGDDPKVEIFSCRFAQEDKCAEFKAIMEKMIAYLASEGGFSPPAVQPSSRSSEKEQPKPLSDIFKQPEGSWNCKACYVNNAERDTACVACSTLKETQQGTKTEKSLADLFKPAEGSWNCERCYLTNGKDVKSCVACSAPKPGSQVDTITSTTSVPVQFKFGVGIGPVKESTSTENHSDKNGTGSQGCDPGAFDFSKLNQQTLPSMPSVMKSQEETVNPFSSISLTAPTFGDLAKNASSTGFMGFQSVNTFKGVGTPVFGNVIASQSAAGDAVVRQDRVDGEEVTDDFVPTAEFQPVIPLPPLVEVKKGNENENTLFEHRAKIYRFVKESKEWKERGVGNIMVLQDKDNPLKIRVVMWRERVYKLACNHWITKDLVIENHQGSPKILKWTVLDFAEGDDPKVEIFSCRFAQEDKCAEFKAIVEKMIAYLASEGGSSPAAAVQLTNEKEQPKPFSDILKQPEGSWNCKACYVNNAERDTACVACSTPKETQQVAKTEKSLADLFKPAEGSWNCERCYLSNGKDVKSCVACSAPKPGSQVDTTPTSVPVQFKFGVGIGSMKESTSKENHSDENGTGSQGCDPGAFDFSKLNQQTLPSMPGMMKSQEETANPFSSISLTAPTFGDLAKSAASTGFMGFQSVNAFSGVGTPVFGNVIASQSAAGDAVVRQDRVEGEEVADDFVPTIEFQPVIPLPPLVEVKKGNENENTLFEHRAKIYRFVKESKEWKERGVGNIMILQDKDNPLKIRVVMWRERVYKLACNHWITKDLVIENHQGSPKILKWTVLDFAEGDDPKVEIFSCRFGQEDKCAEFKATMERMIAYLASEGDSSPVTVRSSVEKSQPLPLSELFMKPSGSWECRTCYVNNTEGSSECISCSTPRNSEKSQVAKPEPALSDLFKSSEGTWSCENCFNTNNADVKNCSTCDALKPVKSEAVSELKSETETVPNHFGTGPVKENVLPDIETAQATSSETKTCSGCIGCDPDAFDFSKLDNRSLPTPPKKDSIQKIKSSSKPVQPRPSAPVCAPITQAEFNDLLNSGVSFGSDMQNTENNQD